MVTSLINQARKLMWNKTTHLSGDKTAGQKNNFYNEINQTECGMRISDCGLKRTESRRHKAVGSNNSFTYCLLPSIFLNPQSAIRNQSVSFRLKTSRKAAAA